jgi:hypothetical protein
MRWYGWGRVKEEGHVARWMYFHFRCWERWQMKQGARLRDIPHRDRRASGAAHRTSGVERPAFNGNGAHGRSRWKDRGEGP